MSICSQIFRETVEQPIEFWETSICNPLKNVLTSVEFMQRLTILSISNITYLHNIFPESAYNTCTLSGMEVKILKPSDKLPLVQKMIGFLRSALDSLAEKYLHKMIFVIEDKEVEKKEVYTLNFSYNTCVDNLDIESDNCNTLTFSQTINSTPDIIKTQTQELLRKLGVWVKNKNFESRKISMHFRLILNEDIPEDFKLKFFDSCEEIPDIDFPNHSCKLKLGKVKTRFHTLTTTNHTCIDPVEMSDLNSEEDFKGNRKAKKRLAKHNIPKIRRSKRKCRSTDQQD